MKDIKNYEGLYAVTEDGRVWSYRRKIFLKPSNHHGYLRVCLWKNNEKWQPFVHRIVLETYQPVENMEDLQCDHIDFNRQNNHLENLRWLEPAENAKRHKMDSLKRDNKSGNRKDKRKGKRKGKSVRCVETGVIYSSIKEASEQTGIDQSNISKACRGVYQTAGGFHWEYTK